MIELSFSKLLLLAVIALLVLGPEKLPRAARMAGAMLRRLRLGWENVRTEVERELQVEEIRRAAREAAAHAETARWRRLTTRVPNPTSNRACSRTCWSCVRAC